MAGDIREAQSALNAKVLGKPGIEGTAIGRQGDTPCLKVYVSSAQGAAKVPSKVGGFRVVVERSGGFRKL